MTKPSAVVEMLHSTIRPSTHSTIRPSAVIELKYPVFRVDEDFVDYTGYFMLSKRSEYQGSLLMIWICQVVLVVLIFLESVDTSEDDFEVLSNYPDGVLIVLARFICGIVLHMSLQYEMRQGLAFMKYAVNHRYKFKNYKYAFLAGFL